MVQKIVTVFLTFSAYLICWHTMKIITWNINSVRIRLHNLEKLVKEEDPDIICLQETKVINENFPEQQLNGLGFDHVYFSGEKSYNGVAILSKSPLSDISSIHHINSDCRHISGVLQNGAELHNFYVPAGGYEPDPEINPKFAHKLAYVEEMAEWFAKNRRGEDRIIMVGDLNIAPLENDVWSHKQLLSVVSHTPPEVERMENLRASLGWVDVTRHFTPESEKLYSWWSYRNQDWRKSDRGRRLDHIWVTKPLQESLKDSYILKEVRDWQKPSDHVPVVGVVS